METNVPPISGDELLRLIEATSVVSRQVIGLYDALTQEAMTRAQKVLTEHGYYLTEASMDEGHFYRFHFLSPDGAWPYHITLRFLTDGIWRPLLALVYREGTTLHQYVGPCRTTSGTGTSDAERMLFDFQRDLPDRQAFWIAAFAGSPLAKP